MIPRDVRASPHPLQCEKKPLPECTFSKLRAEHFSQSPRKQFKTNAAGDLCLPGELWFIRAFI
jgi:hypothetical protein